MDILNNIANQCIRGANALIDISFSFPPALLFVISFITILFWLVGRKLKKFVKPELPLMSPIIRMGAHVLEMAGLFILVIWGLHSIILFLLAELAYIFSLSNSNLGFFAILQSGAISLWIATKSIYIAILSGGVTGLIASLVLNLRIIAEWERSKGLHDVKTLVDQFKKLNGFDPLPYVDVKRGCFIGMDLSKKPIYISWQKINETHVQVIGTTGSGKGVIMSLIAYQAILAGETLIWLDPKFDRFSPRILADAAKKANKDFHLINLNPDQPPQLNLLAGTNAYEIEELLVSAFDLKGKGTDGDFHRGKDEDAAIQASKLAVAENALSFPELITVCKFEENITAQENFWRKLTKLGDLNVVNTGSGLNLEEAILGGAVIYIIGSTDNERVKMLQKLLLVRVNQIIKKKNRFKENSPTCIVLDEFKHLLSPTALTGLGVIRDFNAHCLLAHQSLGDLGSCAGITRAEAEGAVLDNTAIKIVYRIGDSTYAEKLSKNSGKKKTFVEQSGKGLDKNNQQLGGWKESNVPLIDTDLITHLPMPSDRKGQASVGVIFGVGVSKVFFTGHLQTAGHMPVIKAATEFSVQSQVNEDGIYDLI